MASRSRLSYQSVESKGGLFARKKDVQRKFKLVVTAQSLWELFETSKDPMGDILDLIDQSMKIAFTRLQPETDRDWPKVEQLLKFAFTNLPRAIRDLKRDMGETLTMYMRWNVRSVTDAQLNEIDAEVRSAISVLDYLLNVLDELDEGVHSYLKKADISRKEYIALSKDISASIQKVKKASRNELGGIYHLPEPLKPASKSQMVGERSRSRSVQSSSSRSVQSSRSRSKSKSQSAKGGRRMFRKK